MFHKSSKKFPMFFLSQLLFIFTIENSLTGSPTIIQVTTNDGGFNTPGSLNAAILAADDDTIIDCSPIAGQTISLSGRLPALGHSSTSQTPSLTILGSGVTIDGGSSLPVFSLAQGSATISDLTIQNGTSHGGSGGFGFTGGGGGTGGGGALYVHSGTVMTISTVALNNNQASGGAGGAGHATGSSGGGGGGFGGGSGGAAILSDSAAGGGGGNNGGATGATAGNHAGSPNTFQNYGGAGGGGAGAPTNPASRAGSGGTNATMPATTGGAGGLGTTTEGAGGGGGGGSGGSGSPGSDAPSGIGGAGGLGIGVMNTYGVGGAGGGTGFGGGGAGSGTSGGGAGYPGPGGNGGALGGGGGASSNMGGNGGFGAGGGAGHMGGTDSSGLGGSGGSGAGMSAGGGGGSGLGGAIYIQEGAVLIIQDGTGFSGNSTTAGIGGTATSGFNGGNGSSLGADIFIQSGGSLTLQINGTLSIPNPICGAGSFVSSPGLLTNGTGTVSLNGANTYVGGTTIQSGTLNLNGSVVGDLSIESAGTLSGNATVNGNIFSSGQISPGNSIGTVHTTDLYLYPTSVYDVEVNSSGSNDEIIASGFAEVGGGVVVIPDNLSFTAPVTYTIISTGTGVTGAFSSLTSTAPALMSLIYNPLTVQLTYLPLDPIGLTGNALKAANCFVTAPVSDTATVNAALFALSFDDIKKAFGQMGPAQFSDITQVQLLDAILVRSTYTKHMQELWLNEDHCYGRSFILWSDIIGQWQHQKKSNNHFGYNDTTVSATIGADYRIHHLVLGSAISYTHDNFHWKQSAGKANISSYYGGLYGRWNYKGFYINAAFLGAKNKYSTTRHLHFGTINRRAYSNHSGHEWLTNFGVGYQVYSCNFQWTPYINLDYVQLHEHSYTEKGAKSLNLQVNTKNGTLFQGEGGVLLSAKYSAGEGVLVPTLKLAYINQTPFSSKNYHANFVKSTCGFSGRGRDFERNLLAPGLALTYQYFCGLVDASIYYDAEIGNRYWAQDAGFTIAFRF